MWREAANSLGILPAEEKQSWTAPFAHNGREQSSGLSQALLIGGLLALGLGLLGWYYVGHDVKRYLRIRSM
jgi:hypothetical protein